MPDALGQFASAFAVWRNALDKTAAEDRPTIFANAAREVASFIAKGLDKVVAADELNDIAEFYGLDPDQAMAIIAQAFEHVRDEQPQAGNGHDKRTIRILSKAQFIRTFMPPDYLIDGILMRGYLYALTGPTSHAKSAIALLIAELIGSPNKNAVFGSRRVEKGAVLYFVGENPLDISMRVIGSDSKRDDPTDNDQMYWILGQVDFDSAFDEIAAGVAAIGGVALVIIDTSAAYFLGEDEQSNTQMGSHARKLRRLTTLPGNPCVLVLCHPIKHAQEPSQLLPRGGGAFLAEMDGNLTAWKNDDLVALSFTKLRGPSFEPMTFKLEKIETTKLLDSKNRLLPTVRAVAATEETEGAQGRKQTEDEDYVLSKLMAQQDQSNPAIARALGWINDKGEPLRMRVKRALDRLTDPRTKPKLIFKNRDRWELTDEGRKIAARVAVEAERAADRAAQENMTF